MKDEEVILDIQKIKKKYNLKNVQVFFDSARGYIRKEEIVDEITIEFLINCLYVYWDFPNYKLVNEFLDGNKDLEQNEAVQHCLEIAKIFYENNKIYIDNYEIVEALSEYRFLTLDKWDEKEKKEKKLWERYYLKELKKYKEEETKLLKDLAACSNLPVSLRRFLSATHKEETGKYLEGINPCFTSGLKELKKNKKKLKNPLFKLSFWNIEELEELWDEYRKSPKTFNVELAIANKVLKWDRLKLNELKRVYQRIKVDYTCFDKNLRHGISGLAYSYLISKLKNLLSRDKYYNILLILMFYGKEFFDLHIKVNKEALKKSSYKRVGGNRYLYPFVDALRKRAEKYEKLESGE